MAKFTPIYSPIVWCECEAKGWAARNAHLVAAGMERLWRPAPSYYSFLENSSLVTLAPHQPVYLLSKPHRRFAGLFQALMDKLM